MDLRRWFKITRQHLDQHGKIWRTNTSTTTNPTSQGRLRSVQTSRELRAGSCGPCSASGRSWVSWPGSTSIRAWRGYALSSIFDRSNIRHCLGPPSYYEGPVLPSI